MKTLFDITPAEFEAMYRRHGLVPMKLNTEVKDGGCCGAGIALVDNGTPFTREDETIGYTDELISAGLVLDTIEGALFAFGFDDAMNNNAYDYDKAYSHGQAVGQHCRKAFA